MKNINIGIDFSPTPLGRYRSDGVYSGECFRDDVLVPALNENDSVCVKIDDAEGYGSSFLEEAFGGMVRKGVFTQAQLKSKLKIVYSKPQFRIYEALIWNHIAKAKAQPQPA